jgi:hypothetical protein
MEQPWNRVDVHDVSLTKSILCYRAVVYEREPETTKTWIVRDIIEELTIDDLKKKFVAKTQHLDFGKKSVLAFNTALKKMKPKGKKTWTS